MPSAMELFDSLPDMNQQEQQPQEPGLWDRLKTAAVSAIPGAYFFTDQGRKFASDAAGAIKDYAVGAWQGGAEAIKQSDNVKSMMDQNGELLPQYTEQDLQDAIALRDKAQETFDRETLAPAAGIIGAVVAPEVTIPVMIAKQGIDTYQETNDTPVKKALNAMRNMTYGPLADIVTDPQVGQKFEQHPARMAANTAMAVGQVLYPFEVMRSGINNGIRKGNEIIDDMNRELSEPIRYAQTHENVGYRDRGAQEINVDFFNDGEGYTAPINERPVRQGPGAAQVQQEVPITFDPQAPESFTLDGVTYVRKLSPDSYGNMFGEGNGKSARELLDQMETIKESPPVTARYTVKAGATMEGVTTPTMTAFERTIAQYNAEFPDDPIMVTEGMRDQNASYGSPTSYHKSGMAVDVVSPGLEADPAKRAKLMEIAKENGFNEVLDEYSDPSSGATGGHMHFGDAQNVPEGPVRQRMATGEVPAGEDVLQPAEVIDLDQQRQEAWDSGDLNTIADTLPDSPLVANALRKRATLEKGRSALVEGPQKETLDIENIQRGQEAMETVIEQQKDVLDAMHRPDIGSVSFYWGTPKEGVRHIIERRTAQGYDGKAIANKMAEVIARGKAGEIYGPPGGERVNINHGGHTAILSLHKFGNRHTWLLTGWENYKEALNAAGEGYGSLGATRSGPMRTRSGTEKTSSNFNISPDTIDVNGRENMASSGLATPANSPRPAAPSSVRVPETVTRRQLIDKFNELFVKVSSGRLGKRGVLGWFDRNSEVIRTKDYGDLRTIMHEIGHYLDKNLNLRNEAAFDNELISAVDRRFGDAYDNLTREQKRGEGIAEFIHDYTTDPVKAQQEFPGYYQAFEQRLAKEPQVKGKVDQVKKMLNTWHNQAAQERVKGSISFGDDRSTAEKVIDAAKDPVGTAEVIAEKGRTAFEASYDNLVDQLAPLDRIMKEIKKVTGEKIPLAQDIFKQAWLTRGWAGKAQTLYEKGLPKQGVPALKSIIKSVENDVKGFSSYVVALRELDAYKLANKTGVEYQHALSKADAVRTVVEGRKNPAFVKAQKDLVTFQNHLLDILVDAGIKSRASVEAMKAKWPNYAPFFREFDEAAIQKFFGGRGFGNVSDPIKSFKGSTRDIINPLESVTKNIYHFINLAERNKVGRLFVDLAQKPGLGKIIEKVTGNATSRDSTFSVWNNGKKEVFQTTPELYRAIMLLDREPAQGIMKILSIPAGWLRAGAVLSPEFIVRNPVRDAWSAFIYSRYGFIPGIDTARGLMHLLKKSDLYWEYMNSGAAHSTLVSLDRDYLSQSIRQVMSRTTVQKAASVINPKTYIDILRAFSEATEMATRLAAYENARTGYSGVLNRLFSKERTPVSMEEAALGARDITLDFSRSGVWGKEANKYMAFWNTTVQGADKMVRAFKENPVGTSTKTFMSITLPSIVLYYMNRDDPRYQELPQWQKDLFWIIPAKDTLIKIPKPFELGILFGTSVERMLQWADNKKKGDQQAAKHAFKGFGDTTIEVMLPSWIPTAMLPIIEWTTNYSFFMERNIVPQSQAKLPPKLQYGSNTSAIGKAVGGTLNVSPSKVDNTIRGYTGGLGGLAMTTSDLVAGEFEKRPSMKVSEYPGIRAFTATPYKSSQSVQEFYDKLNEQEQLYNEYKQTRIKPEGFNQTEYQRLKGAERLMTHLHQQEKEILVNTKMSSEEKRNRLDQLKIKAVNYARLGLRKPQIK